MSAHRQNSLGIHTGLGALAQDLFIAGALALCNQSRSDPPHQRMKPEKELHQHVERSKRIVPPADMTYLLVENRPELGRAEHIGDSRRDQQDWLSPSNDRGLQQAWTIPNLDLCLDRRLNAGPQC